MNWRMTARDKLAARGATPLGQNNSRIGAGNRRLPRVQTSRVCGEKQHSDAREIWLNRQWSAAALWCLL